MSSGCLGAGAVETCAKTRRLLYEAMSRNACIELRLICNMIEGCIASR